MKSDYLMLLKKYLFAFGMPATKVNAVIRDYEEYFAEGSENNETEADIIKHLGSPENLAHQLVSEQKEIPEVKQVRVSFSFLLFHPLILLPFLLYWLSMLVIFCLMFFELIFAFSPIILLIGTLLGFQSEGGFGLQLLISLAFMVIAIFVYKLTKRMEVFGQRIFNNYLIKKMEAADQ